jgi:hypothetical protein
MKCGVRQSTFPEPFPSLPWIVVTCRSWSIPWPCCLWWTIRPVPFGWGHRSPWICPPCLKSKTVRWANTLNSNWVIVNSWVCCKVINDNWGSPYGGVWNCRMCVCLVGGEIRLWKGCYFTERVLRLIEFVALVKLCQSSMRVSVIPPQHKFMQK